MNKPIVVGIEVTPGGCCSSGQPFNRYRNEGIYDQFFINPRTLTLHKRGCPFVWHGRARRRGWIETRVYRLMHAIAGRL